MKKSFNVVANSVPIHLWTMVVLRNFVGIERY